MSQIIKCKACGHEQTINSWSRPCPECGEPWLERIEEGYKPTYGVWISIFDRLPTLEDADENGYVLCRMYHNYKMPYNELQHYFDLDEYSAVGFRPELTGTREAGEWMAIPKYGLAAESLHGAIKAFDKSRITHATFVVDNPTDEERKIIERIQELNRNHNG